MPDKKPASLSDNESEPAQISDQGIKSHSLHTHIAQQKTLVIEIEGNLDHHGVSSVYYELMEKTKKHDGKVRIVLPENIKWDSSALALLSIIEQYGADNGKIVEIVGMSPRMEEFLNKIESCHYRRSTLVPPRLGIFERAGKVVHEVWQDISFHINFIGAISSAMFDVLKHPGRVRWADAFSAAERAGVNALPIIILISFLVGLIMAFQASIPMRMFGADIFIANLIGLAVIRELGPLMTAIVLTGRSGSAFAAEIGTMKINEEVNALTTMGLDPIAFLVTPRIIAAMLMTPLLAIFADIVGVLGGLVVVMALGHPPIVYYNQVVATVKWDDFVGGLIKCFVFGLLIAVSGCLRGLETGSGPSSVGDSTTKAVVTGIILITVVDGLFAVIYFYLGI